MWQTAAVITGSHDNRSLSTELASLSQQTHNSENSRSTTPKWELKIHKAQKPHLPMFSVFFLLPSFSVFICTWFSPHSLLASEATGNQGIQFTVTESCLPNSPVWILQQWRQRASRRENSASLVYWLQVEGKGEVSELSDFLTQCSQFYKSSICIHLRPIDQSAEADEAMPDYNSTHTHTVCSTLDIKSVQMPRKHWLTQHIAASLAQPAGCRVSLSQTAQKPSSHASEVYSKSKQDLRIFSFKTEGF